MGLITIVLDVPSDSSTRLGKILRDSSSSPKMVANRLASYIQRLASHKNGTITVDRGSVKAIATMTLTGAPSNTAATGTLTVSADPVADETLVVAGVTFTAKASGASGDEYNIAASDDDQTAANIEAAVDASAAAVSADTTGAVVTFTADVAGVVGNALTLTEATTGVAVSGSGTLAGGADETFVVNGVTFTAKVAGASGDEFNIGGDGPLSATAIAGSINGSATAGVQDITASVAAGVITLTVNTPGDVGNASTLSEALSNTTVSGASFTGGSDGTQTVLDL